MKYYCFACLLIFCFTEIENKLHVYIPLEHGHIHIHTYMHLGMYICIYVYMYWYNQQGNGVKNKGMHENGS